MKKILLFIFISLKLFSQYSIDNGIVYIYGRPVTGADINSFEILSDSYAKDKSHVYNADRIIKDADPASFIILSDSAYAKDKTRVYRLGTAIKEADPDSFELFGDTDFSKDKNNVYYAGILSAADTESFEILNSPYARDKNHFYFGNIFLNKIDTKSFKVFTAILSYSVLLMSEALKYWMIIIQRIKAMFIFMIQK